MYILQHNKAFNFSIQILDYLVNVKIIIIIFTIITKQQNKRSTTTTITTTIIVITTFRSSLNCGSPYPLLRVI